MRHVLRTFFQNARKPGGLSGRIMLWAMNWGHASLAKWGRSHVSPEPDARVAAGRCEVRQGDVSRLPYADASFDLVTAFETVYFWPDVSAAFAEVFRVLGPSGVFLIVNEESGDSRWCSIVDGMRTYTADALAGWLCAVGFVDVRSDVRGEGGALCLVARKGPDSVA